MGTPSIKLKPLRWFVLTKQVFLDGDLVYSAPVPYPRHIEATPLTKCSIGWDFNGQMAGAFMLSGAAELKTMMSMLKRLTADSNEGRIIDTSDPDLWIDPAIVSSRKRLENNILGGKYRLVAAFIPSRTIRGRCLEPHNGYHAQLRGDRTHVWLRRSVGNVLRSIGGTAALLPLAHGLLSDASPNQPSLFSGQNVDTVLSVLLTFIKEDVVNQVNDSSAHGSRLGV